jgi:hypothetical protein
MPDQSSALKEFTVRVLRITPRHNDLFGNGIPGEGTVNVAVSAAQQLQQATMAFDYAYKDPKVDSQTIHQLAAEVEGKLMGATIFEIVTDKNLQELVEMLHNLVNARQV